MSLKKLGTYKGQPASLALIEEFYGKSRNLFQYECSCGEKFFTMCYAIMHCAKVHAGVDIEQLIKPAKLIMCKEDLMKVYDDCTQNIQQEFEKQWQQRLQDVEAKLRLEYEKPAKEEKPAPVSTRRASETPSIGSDQPGLLSQPDMASTSSWHSKNLELTDVSYANYYRDIGITGNPIPVLETSTIPLFNVNTPCEDFDKYYEENIARDASYHCSMKLGKRDRSQSPSYEPIVKRRSLRDEETCAQRIDPRKEMMDHDYEKVVNTPRKVIIMRRASYRTDHETVKQDVAGCSSRETHNVERSPIVIPNFVHDTSCYPVDPRNERREFTWSIYYPLRQIRRRYPLLPGYFAQEGGRLFRKEQNMERYRQRKNRRPSQKKLAKLAAKQKLKKWKKETATKPKHLRENRLTDPRKQIQDPQTSYANIHPISMPRAKILSPEYHSRGMASAYWSAESASLSQAPPAPVLEENYR